MSALEMTYHTQLTKLSCFEELTKSDELLCIMTAIKKLCWLKNISISWQINACFAISKGCLQNMWHFSPISEKIKVASKTKK